MKRIISACISLVAALSLGAGAYAADEKKVEKANLVAITATVVAIDQATRSVTLKGPQGNELSFKADEAVKNLPQVKVGDEVSVSYYESLVMRVLKPEEAAVNQAGAGAATATPRGKARRHRRHGSHGHRLHRGYRQGGGHRDVQGPHRQCDHHPRGGPEESGQDRGRRPGGHHLPGSPRDQRRRQEVIRPHGRAAPPLRGSPAIRQPEHHPGERIGVARGDQFREFLHRETSGSVVLLAATVVAVAVANSPLAAAYANFLHTTVGIFFGEFVFEQSVQHWVDDSLMALFFFVVGLEIKREVIVGELSSLRGALLPVLRGTRRHAGARRHLPGLERRGNRRGRVGRAGGDRHRVRARRARAARQARPERPEGVPGGPRHRRRHRCDPRHRALLHRAGPLGRGSRSRSSRWRRSSR